MSVLLWPLPFLLARAAPPGHTYVARYTPSSDIVKSWLSFLTESSRQSGNVDKVKSSIIIQVLYFAYMGPSAHQAKYAGQPLLTLAAFGGRYTAVWAV